MTSFLCHFEQNGANISLIKIAARNRMFSPLGIEAKLIENLLPLWDLKMTHFTSKNDLNICIIIDNA